MGAIEGVKGYLLVGVEFAGRLFFFEVGVDVAQDVLIEITRFGAGFLGDADAGGARRRRREDEYPEQENQASGFFHLPAFFDRNRWVSIVILAQGGGGFRFAEPPRHLFFF